MIAAAVIAGVSLDANAYAAIGVAAVIAVVVTAIASVITSIASAMFNT